MELFGSKHSRHLDRRYKKILDPGAAVILLPLTGVDGFGLGLVDVGLSGDR